MLLCKKPTRLMSGYMNQLPRKMGMGKKEKKFETESFVRRNGFVVL